MGDESTQQKLEHRTTNDMHENVQSSAICNSPKLESMPTPADGRSDNLIVHLHMAAHYPAMRGKDLQPHMRVWMQFTTTMWSKKSQAQNNTRDVIHF